MVYLRINVKTDVWLPLTSRNGGIFLVIISNQLMYKLGGAAPFLGIGRVIITISESVECSRKSSANLKFRLVFSLFAKKSSSATLILSMMVLNSVLISCPAFLVTSGMTITSE